MVALAKGGAPKDDHATRTMTKALKDTFLWHQADGQGSHVAPSLWDG